MNGLPIRDAFKRLLKRGDAINVFEGRRQLLYDYRKRVDAGEYPKEDTMREWLTKGGWRKVMDERWAE